MAELTGDLWRVTVLEVNYSFFHSLQTLGRHLITKKGDLECLEDARRWVDEDPI
jgi:hypothetical protein